MKTNIIVCTALVGVLALTSCTNTKFVSSKAAYDRTIDEVKEDIVKQGYAPSGSSTDTKNNVYVESTSFSRVAGYGSKMANDFITTDTYHFSNSDGNTMSFSVSYKAKQNGDLIYVTDVSTAGCETSNATQYESLCGRSSSIKKINQIPQDASFEEIDVMKTTLAITGWSILATVFIVILAL